MELTLKRLCELNLALPSHLLNSIFYVMAYFDLSIPPIGMSLSLEKLPQTT